MEAMAEQQGNKHMHACPTSWPTNAAQWRTHERGVLGQLLLRHRHTQLLLDGQLQGRQVGIAVHLYALQAIPERRGAASERSAGCGGGRRRRQTAGAIAALSPGSQPNNHGGPTAACGAAVQAVSERTGGRAVSLRSGSWLDLV